MGVHWESNSQSGSSFGNVEVHSLTLSHTLGSMKCDSCASFLVHTFATPYFGHKPKVKVVTPTMHKPIGTLSKLFMVSRTLLLRWLIRNTFIYSIGLNHLIITPNNWSDLSCKMSTRFFATSIRMPHPLGCWQSLCSNSLLVAFIWGWFWGKCPWAWQLA